MSGKRMIMVVLAALLPLCTIHAADPQGVESLPEKKPYRL